jgi:hypothetical protein
MRYRTVDLRSERGFTESESLQKRGWKIGSVGFNTIQFFKRDKGSSERVGYGQDKMDRR